ncbi:hypothetical protein [Enterobacter asburiae]|nr:hypothetical protein [Enterobacter asburiae]
MDHFLPVVDTTQMYLHLSGVDLAARMAGAIAMTDQKVSGLIFG